MDIDEDYDSEESDFDERSTVGMFFDRDYLTSDTPKNMSCKVTLRYIYICIYIAYLYLQF